MDDTKISFKDNLRTLYKPGSWMAKIDFINHLVLLNNVLITVLAEKGNGKTSFCSLLLGHVDKHIKAAFINAEDLCNLELLVKEIEHQLNLPPNGTSSLQSLVARINENNEHVLIIIDNAQNLSKSFIDTCASLLSEQTESCFFHVCLVGNETLAQALKDLANPQYNNLIHSIELGSLNERETKSYMLHKTIIANHLTSKPLDEDQTKQLYQSTGGYVSKINAYIDSFLSTVTTKPPSISKPPRKKIGLVMGLSVAVTLMGVFISQQRTFENFKTASSESQNQLKKQTLPNEPKEVLASTIPYWRDAAMTQWVENALPKKLTVALDETENTLQPVALIDKVIVIPSLQKTKSLESVDQSSLKSSRPELARKGSREEVVESRDQRGQQTLAKKKEIEKQKTTVVLHNRRSLGHSSKQIIAASNSKRKTPLTHAQLKPALSHVPAYTIQLFASHKKNELYRVQQASKLFGKSKIKYFINGQGTWYVLTLGEFNSKESALHKANTLPGSLVKLNPWVRSLSGLRDA